MHPLIHMLLSLSYTFLRATFMVCVSFPGNVMKSALATLHPSLAVGDEGATFYEGQVRHVRHRPQQNSFTYPVRMALVDLESPPKWWDSASTEFMTADQARTLVGTKGPVRVLLNPPTAGYNQNPIAVYYCYTTAWELQTCIAVVQNTPWGAKVTFAFRPGGEGVPKALHVSPFMDMQNTWHLAASEPKRRLAVRVAASHPEHKDYFLASLQMNVSALPHSRSEEAGLPTLLRYGYQPQRAALLIYWQALKLMWKGVPFHGPPSCCFKEKVTKDAKQPKMSTGEPFLWKGAEGFPWNLDQ